jgi:hypothetical protein
LYFYFDINTERSRTIQRINAKHQHSPSSSWTIASAILTKCLAKIAGNSLIVVKQQVVVKLNKVKTAIGHVVMKSVIYTVQFAI